MKLTNAEIFKIINLLNRVSVPFRIDGAVSEEESEIHHLEARLLEQVEPMTELELPGLYDFQFSEWFHKGNVMVRREYLADYHPESIPSLFQKQFGISIYEALGHNWRECFTNAATESSGGGRLSAKQ